MGSMLRVIDRGIQALVFAKFADILGLSNMNRDSVLYPKEVAFRQIAEKRGEAVTEFISLWRDPMAFSWDRQRTSVARKGIQTKYKDVELKSDIEIVRAVPVDLTYNVWFWTKDYEKYNQIAERYLFWQQTNPNLDCIYDVDKTLEYDLHFGELADESSISQMFDQGVYFVLRVPVKVDGWIFDKTLEKTIKIITLRIYDNLIESAPELLYEETFWFDTATVHDFVQIAEFFQVIFEGTFSVVDSISTNEWVYMEGESNVDQGDDILADEYVELLIDELFADAGDDLLTDEAVELLIDELFIPDTADDIVTDDDSPTVEVEL